MPPVEQHVVNYSVPYYYKNEGIIVNDIVQCNVTPILAGRAYELSDYLQIPGCLAASCLSLSC